MKDQYNIKGVKSIFLPKIYNWQYLEVLFKKLMNVYTYNEIKLQLLEKTMLFRQTLGEESDVIRKEMYTFKDKNNTSLTLLPEGTTSCLKSLITHGFLRNNNKQNVWYFSPMFRREKPQKCRQRMFYQIGVESYGFKEFDKELEHILIFYKLLSNLNVTSLILEVNFLPYKLHSILYKKVLYDFFALNSIHGIDLNINPFNFLDKNKNIYKVNIPKAINYINDKFPLINFIYLLKKFGIIFIFNHYLVRGLNYYNNIVYEWTGVINTKRLTVCAGGRYDELSTKISSIKTYSTGFALGVERLLSLLKSIKRRKINFLIFAESVHNNYLDVILLNNIRSILDKKYYLVYEKKRKGLKKIIKDNLTTLKILKIYKHRKNVLL